MIVQRRVFKAKVGKAPEVASKVKEFIDLAQKWGWGTSRVYTDFLAVTLTG